MNPEAVDSNELVIIDFSPDSNLRDWEVEDDVVMGGRSEGAFSLNQEGNAVFSGNVSLENDGGFSSVMYPAYRGERLDIPNYPGRTMAQVRFLIASNIPDSFFLEIDKIWLE